MVCRVCKRELTDPVCSFCGEDNSPYMNKNEDVKTEDTNDIREGKKTAKDVRNSKDKDKAETPRLRYKINKKKLLRFVIVLLIIVAAAICVFRFFFSEDKPKKIKTQDTLFTSGMLAVSANGEWGYVNIDDTSIFAIAPQFRHVTDYHGERAAVCIGGKFCLIDKEGNLICEPKYEAVGGFGDNGLIAVKQDGLWGYINEDAQIRIDAKFSSASAFNGGTAAVAVNGSYGFIGEDGEYTIAPQFDMALPFGTDGLAAVMVGNKWGYVNAEGVAVIEPKYEEAYGFKDGIAVIKQYGDYGLINTDGNIVISPQFDERFYFEDDMAKVKVGDKYGIIDTDGKYIINPRYRKLGIFGEDGLCYAARGDGKYGFIDKEDNFIIKAEFEECGNFNHGLAPVKKDGLWGYIDKEGNEVIDNKYISASEFYDDGYAYVGNVDGSVSVIDVNGDIAILKSGSAIGSVLK